MPRPLQPLRPVRLASEMTKYALAIVVSVHTKTGSFKTWNAVAITKMSLNWHFFYPFTSRGCEYDIKKCYFLSYRISVNKGSNQRFL